MTYSLSLKGPWTIMLIPSLENAPTRATSSQSATAVQYRRDWSHSVELNVYSKRYMIASHKDGWRTLLLLLDSNGKLWEVVVSVAAIANASSPRPKDGAMD